VDCRV